jgi:hypothetical protein
MALSGAIERTDFLGFVCNPKRKEISMGTTSSQGVKLTPGSVPRKLLSGDTQTIKLISALPENGFDADGNHVPSDPSGGVNLEVITEYPDGYQRHHQVKDIHDLLAKISGQLKGRYNLESFEFTQLPSSLAAGQTITVGDIAYVA